MYLLYTCSNCEYKSSVCRAHTVGTRYRYVVCSAVRTTYCKPCTRLPFFSHSHVTGFFRSKPSYLHTRASAWRAGRSAHGGGRVGPRTMTTVPQHLGGSLRQRRPQRKRGPGPMIIIIPAVQYNVRVCYSRRLCGNARRFRTSEKRD